jgi:5-formyltetrahydrofolate cyclo-ligase
MIPNGIGISEIALVAGLVLLFFGPNELPRLMREIGKWVGKTKRYMASIQNELKEISKEIEEPPAVSDTVVETKATLRKKHLWLRKSLSEADRQERSAKIVAHVLALPEYVNASSVMCYMTLGAEVETLAIVNHVLANGKRLIVPYCKSQTADLGIASITDASSDLAIGSTGALEPVVSLRDNFFKSDIRLVLVPGVAFDKNNGRLGRGKSYYDNFLRELKNKVPIIGLAYDCQITDEYLPFAYHDITMDKVITESGVLTDTPSTPTSSATSI